MVVFEETKNTSKKYGKELFLEYPWFYEHIYGRLKTTIKDFFQKEYDFRFISVSYDDENILFFGDEYFVNKIPINSTADAVIRISSGLTCSLLDNTLGASDSKFSIDSLTDVEAILIKSFTLFIYNKLEGLFVKAEQNKKVIKSAKVYNFTFYVEYKGKHAGKIIISVPDYTLRENIEVEFRDDCFDISCFNNMPTKVTIRVGATRISLNDIKSIESGDVIMLEDSDVNKMSLVWEENPISFKITPNPELIISVDNFGGEEMDSESNVNNNMWDTILVDVAAEFDNFKMSLGELKQISEGLVIDVGSIYESKVKLKVAKQVVASGELVILNDRYGVRIDKVKNSNNESSDFEESDDIESNSQDDSIEESSVEPDKNEESDESKNFDYSDFEIEDESI